MSSNMKIFDNISARIQRSANAVLDNENAHRDHMRAKVAEMKRREAEAQLELEQMEVDETIKQVEQRIEALINAGQMPGKYKQFFSQIVYTLPEKFRWNSDGIAIVFKALTNINETVAESFNAEFEAHHTEVVAKEQEIAKAKAQRELEDLKYFDACVDEIVRLFKTKNQIVKSYFNLVGHLKTGIEVPRHRGLDGFNIIVKAIRHQMPGYAEAWKQKLEVGIQNAEAREKEYQQNRHERVKNRRHQGKDQSDVEATVVQAAV